MLRALRRAIRRVGVSSPNQLRGMKLQLDADDDRDTCNIVSRYSPAYVKKAVFAQPADVIAVLVRAGGWTGQYEGEWGGASRCGGGSLI